MITNIHSVVTEHVIGGRLDRGISHDKLKEQFGGTLTGEEKDFFEKSQKIQFQSDEAFGWFIICLIGSMLLTVILHLIIGWGWLVLSIPIVFIVFSVIISFYDLKAWRHRKNPLYKIIKKKWEEFIVVKE